MTTNGTLQWDDHKMESHKFTETISTVRFRFLDSNQSHYSVGGTNLIFSYLTLKIQQLPWYLLSWRCWFKYGRYGIIHLVRTSNLRKG